MIILIQNIFKLLILISTKYVNLTNNEYNILIPSK